MSSDDDGLSTDGPDSIYDTADEEENEEYALTFDLPGMQITPFVLCVVCTLLRFECMKSFPVVKLWFPCRAFRQKWKL